MPPRDPELRFKLIGAHVSTEGGVENAPGEARRIGATAFALFTRNQRAWTSKPLAAESIERFRVRCAAQGYGPRQILPHDSYLINLGASDPAILAKSREAFFDELGRCEQLGLAMLNFHPGAHKNQMSDEQCLDLVAQSINMGLERTGGVTAVVEMTAGQGSSVGHALEHIAYLIERVEDKARVGMCLDTAHAFAAGHDLRTGEGYEQVMAALERTVGLRYLKAVHLNDSRTKLASRSDRHASLGEGELGWGLFQRLMRDPRTDGIPLILETPDRERWPAEIARLRGFAEQGSP